ASADPTSICEGEISTLTAGGASNYSWSHSLGSGAIKTVTPNSTTTYTVTGTNTEGCTGTTTVSVTVNPNADATINPVGNLCDNQSLIILTAATPGGLWSGEGITIPSTGAFSPANVGTGTYTITYMISGQCGDTATIDITVYSSPEVTAYATDESCFNGNDGQAWVEVTNGTPPYTYLWNTYHTISNLNDLAPGVYHVTVTDTHNCSDRDTVIINPGIGDCYQTHIYVPNIFAPDGKGNAENEYLRVYGKGIKDLDFKIFDRWGNEVFHTTDINVGWDGTYKGQPALAGDYTYMLRVTYYNGNNESLKGHIYLIR
ncbi:MAG: gliding motility-associated C-terminal domain-containing protein, partial [Bacteroidales bacterium]